MKLFRSAALRIPGSDGQDNDVVRPSRADGGAAEHDDGPVRVPPSVRRRARLPLQVGHGNPGAPLISLPAQRRRHRLIHRRAGRQRPPRPRARLHLQRARFVQQR